MKRILVIEDDQPICSAILRFLQAENFETFSAPEGQTGFQLAQLHEPDLIICDVMMPGWDGYEVLKQLRQNPTTAQIPFIFLSARSDRSDLRQGMELGADDYLTKPFTRDELLGAIAARLSKQESLTRPYANEIKRAAESLNQLAFRDPLTNLPNRVLLHHRLQTTLAETQQTDHLVAIAYLNLDQFCHVNHELGYATGDTLIQAVAERLNDELGQQYLIARLGVDEFCVVFDHVLQRRDAANLVQQLLRLIAGPYPIDGQLVPIRASAGIALYPDNGFNPNELVNHARMAMRQAKRQGSGNYQFYSLEIDALITQQRWVDQHLGKALERGELQLQYQPQVNLITGRLIGVEALVRWHHPEVGLLYPDQFILSAEDNGLIVPLGDWVLNTACAQAKRWQSLSQMPLKLTVNLSNRQFKQQNLAAAIAQTLARTDLAPNLLLLDLTEDTLMEDVNVSQSVLEQLQELNVAVCIDDFGTGYSSLNYLSRFPLYGLKIDRSLVQDVTTGDDAAAVAKAIIAMAQSLQLKVIAEGVETEAQLTLLKQMGCYAVQGNCFSPPLSAAAFTDLLTASPRL